MKPEKAYKNMEFLNSRDARIVRILSEYLEPQARFAHYNVTDTVVFFGSSRTLPADEAQRRLEAAEADGDKAKVEFARNQKTLSRYYEDARTLALSLIHI